MSKAADALRELQRTPPYDGAGESADNVIDEAIKAVETELQKLRKALEPFSDFAENVDAEGWTSSIHREQISTWFGPSDFRRIREALSD